LYQESELLNSKAYQEASDRIANQRFKQQQPYFDAMKAWNKANDPSIPMPRKEDFAQPMNRTFDFKQTLSEASMGARSAEARAKGFGKTQPKSAIARATQAIQNVTLKGLTPEQVPERLTAWLSDQRRLLTQPEPEPPKGDEDDGQAKQPASPYQGPNPGAPGYQARVEPMVVGGERWQEWSKGKTADDKMAAMRRGDAVSSDQVKRFQGTAKRGAN
jgi:hypothetical protein